MSKKQQERVNAFISKAHDIFHPRHETSQGAGSPPQLYLDVPACLFLGSLKGDPDGIIDPIGFLSRVRRRGQLHTFSKAHMTGPRLSVLVGEYGVGKSELIRQLHSFLDQSDFGSPKILPVRLLYCDRGKAKEVLDSEDAKDDEKFAEFLFGHIANDLPTIPEEGSRTTFYQQELLPHILTGKLLLALDALDELVTDTDHHNSFFDGLMSMLRWGQSGDTQLEFQVLVSMRQEYLTAMGDQGGEKIAKVVTAGWPKAYDLALYFLTIDFFSTDMVIGYLVEECGEPETSFADITRYDRLHELLRRPLLLSIFAALWKEKKERLEWKEVDSAGKLMYTYINSALGRIESATTPKENDFVLYRMDPESLARLSLDRYCSDDYRIPLNTLRDYPNLWIDRRTKMVVESPLEDHVLLAVHRCPFLLRTRAQDHIEFIHSVFQEFLVAWGVALSLRDGIRDPFDNLALEPSTSRFLKYITQHVIHRKWYKETKFAHEIADDHWKNSAHWNGPAGRERKKKLASKLLKPDEKWDGDTKDKELWKELERMRKSLLDYRNNPQGEKHNMKNIFDTAGHLLDEELDPTWLPPRYRGYTYEAIRVLLYHNYSGARANDLSTRFKSRLEKEWDSFDGDTLKPGKRSDEESGKKILADIVFTIGRKLNLPYSEKLRRVRRGESFGVEKRAP